MLSLLAGRPDAPGIARGTGWASLGHDPFHWAKMPDLVLRAACSGRSGPRSNASERPAADQDGHCWTASLDLLVRAAWSGPRSYDTSLARHDNAASTAGPPHMNPQTSLSQHHPRWATRLDLLVRAAWEGPEIIPTRTWGSTSSTVHRPQGGAAHRAPFAPARHLPLGHPAILLLPRRPVVTVTKPCLAIDWTYSAG